jgi:hypothetical protein
MVARKIPAYWGPSVSVRPHWSLESQFVALSLVPAKSFNSPSTAPNLGFLLFIFWPLPTILVIPVVMGSRTL